MKVNASVIPENNDNRLLFYGELTPLRLANTIIESNLLKGKDFREFVSYLSVYVEHHCQHGKE